MDLPSVDGQAEGLSPGARLRGEGGASPASPGTWLTLASAAKSSVLCLGRQTAREHRDA